jgi:hypothetical protein
MRMGSVGRFAAPRHVRGVLGLPCRPWRWTCCPVCYGTASTLPRPFPAAHPHPKPPSDHPTNSQGISPPPHPTPPGGLDQSPAGGFTVQGVYSARLTAGASWRRCGAVFIPGCIRGRAPTPFVTAHPAGVALNRPRAGDRGEAPGQRPQVIRTRQAGCERYGRMPERSPPHRLSIRGRSDRRAQEGVATGTLPGPARPNAMPPTTRIEPGSDRQRTRDRQFGGRVVPRARRD